jgi:hypothetical protein
LWAVVEHQYFFENNITNKNNKVINNQCYI